MAERITKADIQATWERMFTNIVTDPKQALEAVSMAEEQKEIAELAYCNVFGTTGNDC